LDRDEEARLPGAVIEHMIGAQHCSVLGHDVNQRSRHLRAALKPPTVSKQVGEYPLDPGGYRRRFLRIDVGKVETHFGAAIGIDMVESVGPHASQYRQSQERAVRLDQAKPVCVNACDGGAGPPDRSHRADPRLP
jgi:hypothetical protein